MPDGTRHVRLQPTPDVVPDVARLLAERAVVSRTGDPIFAAHARWQAAVAAGRPAVNATLGSLLDDDGELIVHASVMAAIRSVDDQRLAAYAPLAGVPAFRDLLVDLAHGAARPRLSAVGLSTGSLATPGGLGALAVTARNLLDPGQDVILEATHWAPYRNVLAQTGVGSREWRRLDEGGVVDLDGWRRVLSQIAVDQRSGLVWLNDPAHNPTGHALAGHERAALLASAAEVVASTPGFGLTLLIDQAYATYADEPHGWAETVATFAETSVWPNGLMLAWAVSASKSHTLYGLRAGGLVITHPRAAFVDDLLAACEATGRGTWSGAPALPQWALATLHAEPERAAAWTSEVEHVRHLLRDRRDAFARAARHAGLPMAPGGPGYFAFLPHPEAAAITAAAEHDDVFLVPLADGVRVGLCAISAADAPRVAQALARALDL